MRKKYYVRIVSSNGEEERATFNLKRNFEKFVENRNLKKSKFIGKLEYVDDTEVHTINVFKLGGTI